MVQNITAECSCLPVFWAKVIEYTCSQFVSFDSFLFCGLHLLVLFIAVNIHALGFGIVLCI